MLGIGRFGRNGNSHRIEHKEERRCNQMRLSHITGEDGSKQQLACKCHKQLQERRSVEWVRHDYCSWCLYHRDYLE